MQHYRAQLFRITVVACLLGMHRLVAQSVDANGNGMSDIWELMYGAGALDPDGDADGDGVPNRLESFARTDAFDPHSVPGIARSSYPRPNFRVSLNRRLGNCYQLQ